MMIIFALTLLASGLLIVLYTISAQNLIELLEIHRVSPLSKSEVVGISKNTAVILLTYGFIPGIIIGCACSLLSATWSRSPGRFPVVYPHSVVKDEVGQPENGATEGR
jgi:hypothetical protein